MKKIIFFILISVFALRSMADEGMWIPLYLNKYTIEDMQKKGFKLTAEDIYSINRASLKDAVMIFGGGCTAELISDQGLIITNHHCGFSAIQSHSTLEHDYLTDGFIANNKSKELTNQRLTVTFLVRMEDVTEKVLASVNQNMNEKQRAEAVGMVAGMIEKEASENGKYKCVVKPFYYGNQYFLFVQEVFKDVRLVAAPPSAIGKFGGDTDNWMWPRHTGDFSMFRIYTNKNNEPAEYAADNVPYKPKKFFPIYTKGVQKGDFTMVFGYPGRTQEYLVSDAVKQILEQDNPHLINLRQKRIETMTSYMNQSSLVRIQYADKHAGVSNAWKKWIGESRGLDRMNAVDRKIQLEKEFTAWVNADDTRKNRYSNLLNDFAQVYANMAVYNLPMDYLFEAGLAIELVRFAGNFRELASANSETSEKDLEALRQKTLQSAKRFYKDYHMPIDREIALQMLTIWHKEIKKEMRPAFFGTIESKYKGDIAKYSADLFTKSIFADSLKTYAFIQNYTLKAAKKINTDPAYIMYSEIADMYNNRLWPVYNQSNVKLDSLYRIYMNALMEMNPDKRFYPDANSTLRVAYGKVDDYYPADGVKYLHYTTLDGIIAKDNPDIYDYRVPAKLKELYKTKNYGRWAVNGTIPVCFTASNHTTGGNSGSPVINADGYLIGVNFDRNWEGTMSDIMYDPDQCRNITLDIRYVLFMLDKYFEAQHLLDEMQLVE